MSLKTIAQKSVATMFFMLCIMSTLDFKVMEYSSLSKSLSFCIMTAMLSLALNIFLAFGRKKFPFSKSVCAICLWGLYIATYNFITPSEEYRLLYLFSGVMFIVTLLGLLSVNLISKKHIENGLLAIALLHIIYIVGQMAGIIKSSSEFFSVTGSAENPNATAMYLAGVTPLAFNRLRESANKTFYVVLLLVLIVFIILLRCRSAYIGLAVAALVLWLSKASIRLWLLKHSKKHTAITIFVVVSILMFLGYCLYGMKKASADGRIMVWKISATMIAEKPSGYGYGMFEKNYNIFQSDYFANHGGSYNERTNATFTPMAYNDYIEQTVEGGVGGLGLVMFYALLAIGAIRRQLYTELSVILAFATISLFNFVYTSIQPWLLLLCFGAFSLQIEECHGKGIRFAPYLFALLSIYLMYTGLTKAGS